MGGAHECVVDVPDEDVDDERFRVQLPEPGWRRQRCGSWYNHLDDKYYRIYPGDLSYLSTVISYLADHADAEHVDMWIDGGTLRLEANGYRSADIDLRVREEMEV